MNSIICLCPHRICGPRWQKAAESGLASSKPRLSRRCCPLMGQQPHRQAPQSHSFVRHWPIAGPAVSTAALCLKDLQQEIFCHDHRKTAACGRIRPLKIAQILMFWDRPICWEQLFQKDLQVGKGEWSTFAWSENHRNHTSSADWRTAEQRLGWWQLPQRQSQVDQLCAHLSVQMHLSTSGESPRPLLRGHTNVNWNTWCTLWNRRFGNDSRHNNEARNNQRILLNILRIEVRDNLCTAWPWLVASAWVASGSTCCRGNNLVAVGLSARSANAKQKNRIHRVIGG